jgi:CHASE2 domain-containing sensor protein
LLPAARTLLDVGVVAFRVSAIVPIIGLGLLDRLRCRLLDIYRRGHGHSAHDGRIGIIGIIGIPAIVAETIA